MPASVWCDVLSYKDMQDKKDSSSGQSKDMKSSQLHQHAMDLLQNCIQMDDVMLIGLESKAWQGYGKCMAGVWLYFQNVITNYLARFLSWLGNI